MASCTTALIIMGVRSPRLGSPWQTGASLPGPAKMNGMAQQISFDITSKVDLQEVDNAVNQARKEIAQRYDFKGSHAQIEFNRTENTLVLSAEDKMKIEAVWEILQGRLVRRNVPVKNLTVGEIEPASGSTLRRTVSLQQGIPGDKAKE